MTNSWSIAYFQLLVIFRTIVLFKKCDNDYMSNSEVDETGGVVYSVSDDHQSAEGEAFS